MKQLTIGTVIDGKYRIESVLGRGAMGVVVAAIHVDLRERVALKFLHVRSDEPEDFRSRFRREAQVSAKLRNEHIARVIDVATWREHAMYMVMEHLAGTDLRGVLRANGPLPVERALEYIIQVCEGVAEAHAYGIIHRDLKPSNLFVTHRADGSDLVKILDFGISKWSAHDNGEEEELTRTGVILGSPKYMSPEQLFGSSPVDARSDIWSIGAILYELLHGRPPYDQPNFTRICGDLASDRMPASLRLTRPDVSPELEAVIMRCFLRDPAARAQNVADFAGDLLAAIGAPMAESVRGKIRATLEMHSGAVSGERPANLRSTGMHMAMGSLTGSLTASLPSSASSRNASLTGSASGPLADRAVGETQVSASGASRPRETRKLAIWGGAAAVIAAVVLVLVARGSSPAATPVPERTPAASAAAAAAPHPTSEPSARPAETAEPTATTTAAARAQAGDAPRHDAPRTVSRPQWRPAPPAPKATAAVAAAPAQTAAPAAPTSDPKSDPPPRPKPNALEDRQ